MSQTTAVDRMLSDLETAVRRLVQAHRALADVLAAPQNAVENALDQCVHAILSGNAELAQAEAQRQHWLSQQTKPHDMGSALACADTDQQDWLGRWQQLQPSLALIHGYMQQHLLTVGRLGQIMQERIQLLTQAADQAAGAGYAASGKATVNIERGRSLGDA
ncbi:hypothetical protein [Halothiobacillus sp. DCM-1]|uniref:hypothetical protein n=1 Tax=Halothiobacillus sp. DCM-1 TaxID=3112558 RepID=UPI0032483C03